MSEDGPMADLDNADTWRGPTASQAAGLTLTVAFTLLMTIATCFTQRRCNR